MAKLVETQKFCLQRLDHSFFHQGSYSHFLIWWILRKLGFFGLFWGVSNEKTFVTPLERTGKKRSQHDVHNIKKYYRKMSLVFSKNPKNCQNEGVFEVAVMGWRECMNWEKYFLKTSFGSQICFKKKIYVSISYRLSTIKIFRKEVPKKKVDGPTLATPPGSPQRSDFFRIKNQT